MILECGHPVDKCPICGAKPSANPAQNGSINGSNAHVLVLSSGANPTAAPKEQRYIDPWFQGFWREYPRKIGKKPALKAWNACIKSGANPAQIIAQATAYSRAAKRQGIDKRFLKYPAGWLNDERFNDEAEDVVAETPAEHIIGTPEQIAADQAEYERIQREWA